MMFFYLREVTEASVEPTVTFAAFLRWGLGCVTCLLNDIMTVVTVLTGTAVVASLVRDLIYIIRDWWRHIVGSQVRHAASIMAVVTIIVNTACRSISHMTGLASRQG
jgi:hypothetical protein